MDKERDQGAGSGCRARVRIRRAAGDGTFGGGIASFGNGKDGQDAVGDHLHDVAARRQAEDDFYAGLDPNTGEVA